jgi:tetratricopeptide (TPR) repeat protein
VGISSDSEESGEVRGLRVDSGAALARNPLPTVKCRRRWEQLAMAYDFMLTIVRRDKIYGQKVPLSYRYLPKSVVWPSGPDSSMEERHQSGQSAPDTGDKQLRADNAEKVDDDVEASAQAEKRMVDVARQHLERGNDSYKKGDLKDAMDDYQEALLLLEVCDLPAAPPCAIAPAEDVAVQYNVVLILLKIAEYTFHVVDSGPCRDALYFAKLSQEVVNFIDSVLALELRNNKAQQGRMKALELLEEYVKK